MTYDKIRKGSKVAQIVSELQDLTYLSWAQARQSSGTAGSFLKSYDDTGATKVYYKLSDYRVGDGIVGHECVNEIIVDRLLEILGIQHLHYQLIHAKVLVDGTIHETWLNASEDFKAPGESKMALDTYYELERREGEAPLDFCRRMGWAARIWEMLLVDYLILNRDRHGANIEVLRNPRARTLRLAPLFDHGLSLLFRCRSAQDIASFDVMKDLPVQSFIGSSSTRRNLELIPPAEFPKVGQLYEEDRRALFDGLEQATAPAWRDAVWSMIWQRWCDIAALQTA